MTLYALVKTLHVLSGTVLFGTGLGTAWFLWRADRSSDVATIAGTARQVVLADWLFTAPAVVIQPLSGAWLIHLAGYGWTEPWLLWTYGLYALAGACWLPVVWLQLRLRDLAAESLRQKTPLPAAYHWYMRLWFALGWPAFLAVIIIIYLMVAKS
jgi:uncharacterized membrane protein